MGNAGAFGSGAGLVDDVLGNAYLIVKHIYDNMTAISDVAARTDAIDDIKANLDMADEAVLNQTLAVVLAGVTNFRATYAEAVADFVVGEYFTSTESGELRLYKRTVGGAGYTDQGDVVAPVSRSQLAALTGASMIGTSEADVSVQEALDLRLTGLDLIEEAAASNIGTIGGSTVQSELNARPTLEVLIDDTGASLIGYTPPGTGAIATNVAAVLNSAFVWTEQYATFQEAFDAAASRDVELHFYPGKTYAWPATKVTVTGKVKVVADGAILQVASAITALEIQASGCIWSGGTWQYTGPLASGYNADSNAILVTGVRNGAAVAPTFIEDVWVEGATFTGFGNTGLEFRFARNCGDRNIRCLNLGYAGVFLYSVDVYRSSSLFVNGLSGQVETGNPATSELNAYGITATALTGGGVDRVRDPISRDVFIDSPVILNVPTWHAIDTHGGSGMIVRDATIIDCRRGVVFTGLTDTGAADCKAINCSATNSFGPADINANGTFKKGEAFWDIGPSGAIRNLRNRFEGCTSFGHGNPSANEGAVTIANASDGFYDIHDTESQRVGWKFGANTRATVKVRSTNTRHASINPSVARVEGNDIDLRIASWRTGPRNAALDTNVMVNGIVVVAGNTGGTIHFEDFDLTACTAGELVSTVGNTISATLTGNYSIMADLTLTGVDAVVTASVRFIRQGRLCSAQIPPSELSGTSNATTCTLTGVPANFRPSEVVAAGVISALDGGATYALAFALVDEFGVITLTRDADSNTSAWIATGLKSLRGGMLQWSI